MPQRKSVTRSRKSPKKSARRQRKSRSCKSPKKSVSRISPKNRSYRFSETPETYKCVKPYNKGTATAKQRVASCDTKGPSVKGHPEYKNLQLCTQECFLSGVDEENVIRQDKENQMKEWKAQYEASKAETEKRREEHIRNYNRERAEEESRKKAEEEARARKKADEGARENEFLDKLSDQLIKKIEEIKISLVNTTEINNLIKDIPTFLHAHSKPRQDALARIAVRVKDRLSSYELLKINSHITDKVASYCIAYLEKMEDKKEERGEKRTFPKNGLSVYHLSTQSTRLKLNDLIESKDSVWTSLLNQSRHFNLEQDLNILLKDYRELVLYDNLESLHNIIIKCAAEKGMECLEKEASKNCSIM